MPKPRLLDLFCGAGGCSVGYHQAGFEVVGVDIKPQKHYPFEFHQTDALEFLAEHGREFDAIHASPPCQSYSKALKHLAAPQPMLVGDVRDLCVKLGRPFVIENVEGAPVLKAPGLWGLYGIQLCGTSFGLRVYRHRLFESNKPLQGLPCNHHLHAMNPHSAAGRKRMYVEFGKSDPERIWKKEMGVEWMGRYEAREAIPPIYTEFIGRQLLAYLGRAENA